MKRLFVFTTLLAVLTGSCSALQTPPESGSPVDMQATIDSIVRTASAQTLAVQPSPTTALATDTAIPTSTFSPTAEAPDASSLTSAPNLTTTPATATSGPGDIPTETPTATKAVSANLTQSPTLGPLLWGTLPPAVPFANITIVNKSKTQVYISLQNQPPDRQVAILEYPVKGHVKVKAPLGYYLYVVWVGGRKIVGNFTLHADDELTIDVYRDRVEIKQ